LNWFAGKAYLSYICKPILHSKAVQNLFMPQPRQVKASFYNPAAMLLLAGLTLLFSCVIPKKYQANKPFVFKTIIKVEGVTPNEDRKDVVERMNNQLDDSLRTNIISYAGLLKMLISPPAFDSFSVSRSIIYMGAQLKSLGYYTPSIKDSIRLDTAHHHQYRATVIFLIRPGKKLIFDSVGYDLQTPSLQQLAIESADKSAMKKGKPYSIQILSLERDRLVELFHNNGYYRFSKDDLSVEVDTVTSGLLNPTLDPFEQLRLLEELKKKRENPTINAVIKQNPVRDSSHLTKYYIGQVTVYPDLPLFEDTAHSIKNDTTSIKGITLIARSDRFKLPFIVNNIFLQPGNLYKQDNYYRTSNRFSQLPAWQLTNIDLNDSYLSDSLLDVSLRMYPAKHLITSVSPEVSYNTNDILTASNLFGVGVTFELRNRNTFRQSVQSITDLNGGVEFGSTFIQTYQTSLSHSIIFPRLISPIKINQEGKFKNVQTVINVNASYTNRDSLFSVKSINGSWGYQLTKNNKTYIWRPINIEYTDLIKTDSFQKYLNSIPSLNLAFKTGLVVGQQFIYSSIRQKNNKTDLFRFSFEESGALLGLITSLDEGALWRFVKGDVDFSHNIKINRTNLVFHGYAGAGIAYGRSGNGLEETLPFYKAFYAGGPNSMRGWQVRQLGLGSSTFYDDTPNAGLDRFGDIHLEGNIEYRFPLGSILGYKINSAIFTDVGNIWNRKVIDPRPSDQGSDFNIGRFYKEFAVDVGTGLRVDFNFFIIRLDWAYKIKDPELQLYSDRWFYGLSLGSGQLQIGIGYPF
jgi:outer membrane protein insertion porin family